MPQTANNPDAATVMARLLLNRSDGVFYRFKSVRRPAKRDL